MAINTNLPFNVAAKPTQTPSDTTLPNFSPTGGQAALATAGSKTQLTNGWYVFFGVGGGVLLSNTRAAPVILALLSSALIYQIGQLIAGK